MIMTVVFSIGAGLIMLTAFHRDTIILEDESETQDWR